MKSKNADREEQADGEEDEYQHVDQSWKKDEGESEISVSGSAYRSSLYMKSASSAWAYTQNMGSTVGRKCMFVLNPFFECILTLC